MAVFLQNGNTEAVEGVDVSGVVIAGQIMDALAHFAGGFVGEGNAKDIAGQDADLVHKVSKPPGKGAGLAGTGPRDHAHKALRCRHGLTLRLVQAVQQIFHADPPCPW